MIVILQCEEYTNKMIYDINKMSVFVEKADASEWKLRRIFTNTLIQLMLTALNMPLFMSDDSGYCKVYSVNIN